MASHRISCFIVPNKFLSASVFIIFLNQNTSLSLREQCYMSITSEIQSPISYASLTLHFIYMSECWWNVQKGIQVHTSFCQYSFSLLLSFLLCLGQDNDSSFILVIFGILKYQNFYLWLQHSFNCTAEMMADGFKATSIKIEISVFSKCTIIFLDKTGF